MLNSCILIIKLLILYNVKPMKSGNLNEKKYNYNNP